MNERELDNLTKQMAAVIAPRTEARLKLRDSTAERLRLVVGQDPNILSDRTKPEETKALEEDHLILMGLERRDFKELEKVNLMKRAYLSTGTGFKKRWILYAV